MLLLLLDPILPPKALQAIQHLVPYLQPWPAWLKYGNPLSIGET